MAWRISICQYDCNFTHAGRDDAVINTFFFFFSEIVKISFLFQYIFFGKITVKQFLKFDPCMFLLMNNSKGHCRINWYKLNFSIPNANYFDFCSNRQFAALMIIYKSCILPFSYSINATHNRDEKEPAFSNPVHGFVGPAIPCLAPRFGPNTLRYN